MALRRGAARLFAQALRQQGQCEVPVLQACGPSVAAVSEGSFALGGVRQASQLAVKQRMRSVTNIQKITKAMKMVAASKMRIAQANTEKSRGLVQPFLKLLGDMPDTDTKLLTRVLDADVEKNLTVAITTDKGLCGGINSTVCRYVRGINHMYEAEPEKTTRMVVVGDKGRAQLTRTHAKNIDEIIQDVGKLRITFAQAGVIAEELLKTEYDAARLVFNRFQSAIAFKPTITTVLSPDALEKEMEAGGTLDQYEVEGPDRAELLQDLGEFQLATMMYNALLENNCSEQASRMSAMESSTKNATEMLAKLTLTYNRTRQAAITTELTEIISGAAALEG